MSKAKNLKTSKRNKNKEEKKKSNILLNLIIVLFLIIIAGFLYAKNIGTSSIFIKEYKIESNSIPKNFSGVKIIHFSDLHYGNTTFLKDIKLLVGKINNLKPDLVLFTGDLIDKNYKLKNKEKELLIEELKKIDTNLGIYVVKGNEDYTEEYDQIITSLGFTILNNSYDLIYKDTLFPIFIGGTSSSKKEVINLDNIFNYFIENKENVYIPEFKIILTHEGDNATQIMEKDKTVNLILGGHSLNGSVVVPYYGGIFIPDESSKYYAPHYTEGNTEIFISSGIGTSKIQYRLFNRPSFNLYRLKSK